MLIDDIDMYDLPADRYAAFVYFEKRLRDKLAEAKVEDRRNFVDHDDRYFGDYEPERYYVSSVLAFLDEYDVEIDVPDITELSNHEFISAFSRFFNKVNYARTRLKLRDTRMSSDTIGTAVFISGSYKEEIGSLLDTIRKIVNQKISDPNKKDKIYNKISSLQNEVDRDRTTVDALFSRTLQLGQVAREFGSDIEPLVDKLERLRKLVFEAPNPLDLLPKRDRPLLEDRRKEETNDFDLDDDIPF